MSRADRTPATPSTDRWALSRVLVTVALVSFLAIWLFTKDLFVFTEARGYAMYRPPLDPLRFLLFPVLDWGSGYLFGIVGFQATGEVCGVDAGCFAMVGAALSALAAVLLVVHTRQITGSTRLAVVAAAFWVTAPALLGVALWQSARLDLMAFICVLAAAIVWWEVLGRRALSPGVAVGAIVVGTLLLDMAFNTKGIAYVLVGMLPILGVLRGLQAPARVRRNLLLIAVPLAWSAWFITYGLSHMDPVYAARVSGMDIVVGFLDLARAGLGVDRWFMYLPQEGALGGTLRWAAIVGYLVTAILAIGLVAAATWSWLRRRSRATAGTPDQERPRERLLARAASLVVRFGVEAYLLAIIGATMLILSRNVTPAAYYLLIPTWAAVVLVLLVLRRAAAQLHHGRGAATVVVAAWAVTHVLVVASLAAPGSAHDQLVVASDRMRDIGGTLRVLFQGRSVGPVAWRTIGVPATDFYLLRDASQGGPPDGQAYAVGQDLMPYLRRQRGWGPRVTPLWEGTVASIRAGSADLSGPGQIVVVIDADYRLLLVLHEGEVIFEVPTAGGAR